MSNIRLEFATQKKLNTFLVLLNQFVADGVTDIREVQRRVDVHLSERRKTEKVSMSKEARARAINKNWKSKQLPSIKEMPDTLKKCPSCKTAFLLPPKYLKEPILHCPKCGYSEYVGVDHV